MKCSNCGKDLNENEKFCPNCGLKVNNKEEAKVPEATIEEKQIINGMKNDTFFCVLSLICMYGLGIISALLNWLTDSTIGAMLRGITSLGPIAAWVLVLFARIRYKDSKFAKILLIIYIIQLVVVIIFGIFIIVSCLKIANDCGNSGFGFIYNLM